MSRRGPSIPSRVDDYLIDHVAQPATDYLGQHFNMGCFDVAILMSRCVLVLGWLALLLGYLEDARTPAATLFLVLFCWVLYLGERQFVASVRPYARRARDGEFSWSLPPFRHSLFVNRMLNTAIMILLLVYYALDYTRMSPASVLIVALLFARHGAYYSASCRPRPPGARSRQGAGAGWLAPAPSGA